jgi:triacylglycerol lipase
MLPIALCHGLFGYDQLTFGPMRHHYWRGIDRALARLGHPVIVTRVSPAGGIVRRAAELKASLLRHLDRISVGGRQKLIVVGHSMGGLDLRYLVSHLGFADRVAAVLTVCTPHRGSPFADYAIRNLDDRLRVLRFIRAMNIDIDAVKDLTTTSCKAFNEQVRDVPGLPYYSISACRTRSRMAPWGLLSHEIIRRREGENDGLVSVASARWGTHLGTWAADHWHSINRRLPELGRTPTGDIAPYYVRAIQQVDQALRREPVAATS